MVQPYAFDPKAENLICVLGLTLAKTRPKFDTIL